MNEKSSGSQAENWCIDGENEGAGGMRAGLIVLLLGLLALAGCSKCGDFLGVPRACHSETPSAR